MASTEPIYKVLYVKIFEKIIDLIKSLIDTILKLGDLNTVSMYNYCMYEHQICHYYSSEHLKFTQN